MKLVERLTSSAQLTPREREVVIAGFHYSIKTYTILLCGGSAVSTRQDEPPPSLVRCRSQSMEEQQCLVISSQRT